MDFSKILWSFLNVCQPSDYPFVTPEIDLRLRLPKSGLSKLTVLNIGVGSGDSGLARQLPYLPFFLLDFIDVHQPYLDNASKKKYASKICHFIKADARQFDTSIYDLVLMFDVLEHLPKEDSLRIMEKIKSKQIIFIPLEERYRENSFGVKSQDHLSFWTEDDFIKLGYQTERLFAFHREGDDIFDALWAVKN
ncbi:MAG: class I SAM-dependent methyltransferase [Candidatus Parcubacteria bacterium]|nr:class I SAM-dependent methyltransferase [Candidatus Parcubacteria bacterium]